MRRSNIVICKCKSHCTTLNPVTGKYQGEGKTVNRSTRDNHSKDDKELRGRLSQTATGPGLSTATNVQPSSWIENAHDELDALASFPVTSPGRPLIFLNRPSENGEFQWPSNTDDISNPNRGLYSLTADHSNKAFIFVESRLCELLLIASRRVEEGDQTEDYLTRLREEIGRLTREKEVEWAQQRGQLGTGRPFVNTEIHFRPLEVQDQAIKAISVLILVMENIYFTPRRALRALLGGLKSLLRASNASPATIDLIPVDPRPAAQKFRLHPVVSQFVVCPSCHNPYPYHPGDSPSHETEPFILICNRKRTPESPMCSTPLWKTSHLPGGVQRHTPVKKYLHQELKAWLGRLLARKGMEEMLDNPYTESVGPADSISDIWLSKIFGDLKDAFGAPFFDTSSGEGRLVFSLSIDSFNPFHMKTAKQTASSTGIWLVLLNLPQHLRYLPENMYLAGVIPADKPSKEDLYPYIWLVVKELLEFWNTGVMFSHTYQCTGGRLFRAMLIPLICDMLAARQAIGFGSATSHNFCTHCDLDIDDIEVLDRTEWPQKDFGHILHVAQRWRKAASEKDQKTLFDMFGIRWTPLYELPYWNPVLYSVIDSMHALDLNLLQNHCRALFQIDTNHSGGDGSSTSAPYDDSKRLTTKELQRSHKKCIALIDVNEPDMDEELLHHPRRVLFKICSDNNILGHNHKIVVGVKWLLVKNIILWRRGPLYQGVISPGAAEEQADIVDGESQEETLARLPNDENLNMVLVSRIIRHLVDEDDRIESRRKAFDQGLASSFVYICDLLDIGHDNIDKGKRTAKRRLFDKITESIDNDLDVLANLRSFTSEATHLRHRAVLGKGVMEFIWSDMTRTQLPTWITKAPANWGTTQRGKLSADNWRVICTVHLPITLIRIWKDGTSRKKELLSHFMDLVTAVRIANMRITSAEQIRSYNGYMGRYIKNIRTLYPDQNLKPSHHAALHIGDMLGLFGPNHSHSTPHYERYINFFHRINTNSKPGQLESTFLRTSARSANTRAILADNEDIRDTVHELVSVMEKINLEDARGFRLATILDPNSPTFVPRSKPQPSYLEDLYHRQLCDLLDRSMEAESMPREVMLLREISFRGDTLTVG